MKLLPISIIIAFFSTIFTIHLLKPLAVRLSLVDKPGGRKKHTGLIPLVGGVGIFLGFLFAILTLNISLQYFRPILAAMGLLVFVGVLDDFSELTPRSRLITQLIAALLIVVWGGAILQSFGDILGAGPILLAAWSIPISIVAVIGVINAVNMTDGLDGLAGGMAFVQLFLLAVIAFHENMQALFSIICLMLASLLGFLIFNFPRWRHKQATVFLGDAGSMLLGVFLVWLTISISQTPSSDIYPVTMLWIVMFPLFDIAASTVRRLLKGKSIFQADSGHFHHIFQMAGYQKSTVTYIMCTLTLTFGLIGLWLNYKHVPEWVMLLSVLTLFFLYYWAITHAWRVMKFIKIKLLRRNRQGRKQNAI